MARIAKGSAAYETLTGERKDTVFLLHAKCEVVARALDGVSPRPYVFTKCSMVWNDQRQVSHSLKRDSLRRERFATMTPIERANRRCATQDVS